MKITKKTGLLIIALVCVLSLLVILLKGNKETTNEIRIGAILPLTGYAATNGQMSQKALELAIDSINKCQSKYKYTMIYEDSKSTPKDAASAYSKLHSQNVKFIIGFGGATLYSFIPKTNNQNEILFATATPNPGILELSNRCIRVYPTVPMVTGRMLDFVKENNYKSVALLYIQNEVYSGYANIFKKQIEEAGINLSFFEGYDPSTIDFKNIINKLIASKPDCIYLASTGESTGVIIRQLYADTRIGDVPIIGDISLANSENIALIGEIKTPVYIVNGPIQDSFINIFKTKYGSTPNAFAAYSYAIPFMIKVSVDELGKDASMKEYYECILKKSFASVIGGISFNKESHEPKLDLVMVKL